MVNSFRDLEVWKKGMDLADAVYTATTDFPRSELFGLAAQIRKAVVSIPSNIAEGNAVGGGRYLHHLRIALGSEAELQTQLELSVRRGYISSELAQGLLSCTSEVGRMLHGLHDSLKRRQARARLTKATGLILILHAAGFWWN